MIFATTPAPTVRPPSRIAKRKPSSIAIGWISAHRDRHIVPRHHHLRALRQLDRARHVRRAEVKLRPIPVEKRRVPTPLLLRQHVNLRRKLRVRRDRARLRQHLPPLHLLALRAPQQDPHVVARLTLVQQLPEHLHARAHRLQRRRSPTISISSPTFTTPRSTRPVTTVPRPEIENTSSTGIRNVPSSARFGCGM
jgi:hypothetical protein